MAKIMVAIRNIASVSKNELKWNIVDMFFSGKSDKCEPTNCSQSKGHSKDIIAFQLQTSHCTVSHSHPHILVFLHVQDRSYCRFIADGVIVKFLHIRCEFPPAVQAMWCHYH
jgi:hypothetical protein